jgi:hypothetical protein
MDRKAVAFLRNDSQAKVTFIDRIAAPVLSEMPACGLILSVSSTIVKTGVSCGVARLHFEKIALASTDSDTSFLEHEWGQGRGPGGCQATSGAVMATDRRIWTLLPDTVTSHSEFSCLDVGCTHCQRLVKDTT